MHDEASVLELAGDVDDRLMRRVDMVMQEIERMKEERNGDAIRTALIRLQAVHAAKRLRKLVDRR